MNDKTMDLLEFTAIRSRVADRSLSEEAAVLLLETKPLTDRSAVLELRRLVSDFVEAMITQADEPRSTLPTVGSVLVKLRVEGMALELEEAYALGIFVERVGTLVAWLDRRKTDNGPLALFVAGIPDLSLVAREVFRVLDKDGTLRDLSEFREIKRRIHSLNKELESLTSRYLSSEDTRRMLQSEVPSQRDGRMVLAVKANYRGRIKGIVHEVSSTGQTLFVEPEDVVEKNNDILIEKRRLDAEIARVLREMTARIAEKREELSELHGKALTLEGIRARARYSRETGGAFPRTDEDTLVLKQARHPLLGSKAVPIDLAVDSSRRTVIITGPNTGGKTVALKTVGLFAMMNQFGLALPAQEGSALPLFDGVFADIGDEQSISQSLSTFSSHMTHIALIAEQASADSLVLLDELGSGTDPEEGSAIAMSILDHFIQRRCRVLCTTHHGILKNYGYAKPGVENASVEFDGRTLSPTYRIVMGIPGESRALDIALRNGLPADIVQRARGYLDEERADVSALIRGLKEKHRQLQEQEGLRKEEELRLREDRRKADLKELRLRQKELELKNSGLGNLQRLLSESRKTLENLVREVKEGELTRDKTLKVKEFLAELEATVGTEDAEVEREAALLREERRIFEAEPRSRTDCGDTDAPLALGPGVEVLAGPSRRRGLIQRRAKKGYWVVEIGDMKMTLKEDDLVPVASAKTDRTAVVTHIDLAEQAPVSMELNLRGFRLEEALDALRRQIDGAALSGLCEFSVIHGKGDGILQRGIHDYLKNQALIADYHFSRPEEGGAGKTWVSLKR